MKQAGFRRERGCTDQIFTLKNIIEQCVKWNAPLHINFIDLWKAFDSLQHGTLWKVVRVYEIPPKIVTVMGLFYGRFECIVIVNEIP